MTSRIVYQGNLRTTATHLQSNTAIETDAPTDNQGKGERFSPTDLTATSLGACMLTMMGIAAKTHDINMDNSSCEITKIMVTNPRRIGQIKVRLNIEGQAHYNHKQKMILENTAMTCPVLESLHPEIQKTVEFYWNGIEGM